MTNMTLLYHLNEYPIALLLVVLVLHDMCEGDVDDCDVVVLLQLHEAAP